MKFPVSISVNGRAYQRDVEPRLLLVHFLRDIVGLTGTKIGCDTSQCGACTVLLEGAAVKACTCLAVQADGSFALTYLYSDGVVRGSHLRRFAPTLEQIGEPFPLGASLAEGGNGIHFAVVDAAPAGGFVVSFVEPGDDVHRLYAARFDAAVTQPRKPR